MRDLDYLLPAFEAADKAAALLTQTAGSIDFSLLTELTAWDEAAKAGDAAQSSLAEATAAEAEHASAAGLAISDMDAALNHATRSWPALETLNETMQRSVDASVIFGGMNAAAEALPPLTALETLTAGMKGIDASVLDGMDAAAEALPSLTVMETLTHGMKGIDASLVDGIDIAAALSSFAVATAADAEHASAAGLVISDMDAALNQATRSWPALETLNETMRRSIDASVIFDGMNVAAEQAKQSSLAFEIWNQAARKLPLYEVANPLRVEPAEPSAPLAEPQDLSAGGLAVAIHVRYQQYLDGKESVGQMAFACLTMLQARAGSRKQAVSRYRISPRVLNYVGYLSSNFGDLRTARKFTPGIIPIPHSRAQIAWLEAAIEGIANHLGRLASSRSTPTRILSLCDLP